MAFEFAIALRAMFMKSHIRGPRYSAYDDTGTVTYKPQTRHELLRRARLEARVVRGKSAFVWQARMLMVGAPIAALAGWVVWRRTRSELRAMGAVAGTLASTYAAAQLEWKAQRRRHRTLHGGS